MCSQFSRNNTKLGLCAHSLLRGFPSFPHNPASSENAALHDDEACSVSAAGRLPFPRLVFQLLLMMLMLLCASVAVVLRVVVVCEGSLW